MIGKMSQMTQIFLLKLFLVMAVSARSLAVGKEMKKKDAVETYLPASDAQKDQIVQSVCADLADLRIEDVYKCSEDFVWKTDSDQMGIRMRCRSKSSITFEVVPSHLYRLILLVPDPNNNDIYGLFYSIIGPNSKYGVVPISQGTNYRAFSAVLDRHGRPRVWHHETDVAKWNPPVKEYSINVEFDHASSSKALFSWNQTGEFDACFELVAYCENNEMMNTEIWPDSPPRAVLNLPPDETCYVQVIGTHGNTQIDIRTPKLKQIPHARKTNTGQTRSTEKPPEFTYPKHVRITAEDDGGDWMVTVAWSKLIVTPDVYNVTLRAERITTVVVSGNATQAVFRGISGKGVYNVSIYAIRGEKVAHTSRTVIFPPMSGVWRWMGAAGGAWGVAGAAAVTVAMCWLRLRRKHHMPEKETGAEGKILDDNGLESVEVEGVSSDGWEVKFERLLLHEVIGEGAFGVVRRGTLAPAGKEVAVKMLKEFPSLEEMRAFRLEMELMKSVGAHPHVVSLVGCCSGRRPRIVAEYCSRGDLLSFLRCSWDVMVSKRNAKYYNNNIDTSEYRNDLFKCNIPQEHSRLVINKMYDLQGVCDTELTSLDLLSFCRQIAMGMEFLAANRLVHRDLAARNILVTSDRTLKIADFGLSRDVYEENQYKQKGNGKMPVKWMAPESLTRRIYSSQSDVWSFGVVVWEVVTVGGAPYPAVPAARLPRLLRAGYRMPRPHNCSSQLYEIMQSCWRALPRERPTFPELHARLDELLNCASADHYLSLELDDEPPPPSAAHRYFNMIIRAKRSWTRSESYERPLRAPHNHYTLPPVTLSKTPV